MGFLLKLQTLDEGRAADQRATLASAYSLTACLSTTSQTVC